MTFRIHGMFDGERTHRIKTSFEPSVDHDFSRDGKTRKLSLRCSDLTGTNDFVELVIECDTEEECLAELNGQLSDGIFENCRTGAVERIG